MPVDLDANRGGRKRAQQTADGEDVVAHVDSVVSTGRLIARVLVVDAGKSEGSVRLDGRLERDLVARLQLR